MNRKGMRLFFFHRVFNLDSTKIKTLKRDGEYLRTDRLNTLFVGMDLRPNILDLILIANRVRA